MIHSVSGVALNLTHSYPVAPHSNNKYRNNIETKSFRTNLSNLFLVLLILPLLLVMQLLQLHLVKLLYVFAPLGFRGHGRFLRPLALLRLMLGVRIQLTSQRCQQRLHLLVQSLLKFPLLLFLSVLQLSTTTITLQQTTIVNPNTATQFKTFSFKESRPIQDPLSTN